MTTVQFRIDRPSRGVQPIPKLKDTFPRIVWVLFPPVPVTDYPCKCSKLIYKVTSKSVKEQMLIGLLSKPKENSTYVCPCMGEIIE